MRKYNRLNCDSTVRARFIDTWGRVITLVGTHAFEYAIHIEVITEISSTLVIKEQKYIRVFGKLIPVSEEELRIHNTLISVK